MMCVRSDSGSTAAVDLDPALINDRHKVSPPAWAPCWSVIDDALRPGEYLLVGWHWSVPHASPRASL